MSGSIQQKIQGLATPTNRGAWERLDPTAYPRWDALLLSHPGYSFFHSEAWARVLKETYRYEPFYLAQIAGQRLTALIPMLEVRSWATGCRGVSLPFSDCCEPLMPESSGAEGAAQALQLGRERKWRYAEFRGGEQLLAGAPTFREYLGHDLCLEHSDEELLGNVDSSVRRALRKAQDSGLTVRLSGSDESLRDFYELFCQTRKMHGVPPQSFRFFQIVQKHVLARDRGILVMCYAGTEPAAACMYFHLGKRAIYKFGCSDRKFQQLRPSNLVMWEAIQHYSRAGCSSLHFGRTAVSNEGLRKYKLGWGTTERALRYFRFDYRQNGFVVGKEESTSCSTRICQKLPIPVLRGLGGLLYGHAA